MLASY